jgi:hypothetical protein
MVKTQGGVASVPVLTANFSTAPDGTQTASRLQLALNGGTTTTDRSDIAGNTINQPLSDGATRTSSVWLKSNTASNYLVLIRIHAVATVVTVTPTWQRFSVSGSTTGADRTNVIAQLRGSLGTSDSADLLVWGAQLELGSTASEYIPATSAAASSPSGNYYWQFDGSNDSLALSAVPFQMADDHCVVAGYAPTSLAANADLYAQRSTASANPITLLRVSTSGAVQALHRDDAGTIQTASSTGSVAAGSSCVASMRRSSGVAIARRNGGNQSPDGTQAFGTTTFTSAAIGVSPLATPGGFSNGSIYPVIAIKGTVTDADLLTLERWVGSLSGVSI